MTKPDCSNWRCWVGPEIEGSDDLGVQTLFIRRVPATVSLVELLNRASKLAETPIGRVWFCAECFFYAVMREALEMGCKVCVELNVHHYQLPPDIRDRVTIYFKVSRFGLRPGDYVCVGDAFSDEAFKLGTGSKVTPDKYAGDKRIF